MDLIPESLEVSDCHSRKVKSYTLQLRGFLPAPDVRSLLYFIHTIQIIIVRKCNAKN